MNDAVSPSSPAVEVTLVHPLEQLARIDRLLMARQYIEAGNAFIAFLEEMGGALWQSQDYDREDNHGSRLNIYGEVAERAGNQWRQVLVSGCDLLRLDLIRLANSMYQLHLILMGSYQGNMDDVILAQHQTCKGNYDSERLLRLLLAWCPASRAGIDIFDYYPYARELVLAHAIATVGGMTLVSAPANATRNRAIDFMNKQEVPDGVLAKFGPGQMVLGCWMRCSYAEHPHKHQVKKLLMRLSDIWCRNQYAQMPEPEVTPLEHYTGDKPLLVVPLERFTVNHAMYRCYAPIIRELRQRFYLVGLGATGNFDDGCRSLFDEFFNASDFMSGRYLDIRPLVVSIRSWQPQALYYPSVGMIDWIQQLSCHRLAPVQVMTLGHPATSQSPEMDYVLIDQRLLQDRQVEVQGCFSEKVISVPNVTSGYLLPPEAERVQPLEQLPQDGIIRIAIPSVAQKLSAGFIDCLKALEDACPDKVEFVFFLGERSLQAVACLHQLRRELRRARYLLQLPYNDYIREINNCQLHACSFPFGGTNSLVDSLRQGLPILTLEGVEPHARIDASFVRRVGLPDSLICHSVEAYQQRLIELVQSPQELQALKHHLLHEGNIDHKLLEQGEPQLYCESLLSLINQGAA